MFRVERILISALGFVRTVPIWLKLLSDHDTSTTMPGVVSSQFEQLMRWVMLADLIWLRHLQPKKGANRHRCIGSVGREQQMNLDL